LSFLLRGWRSRKETVVIKEFKDFLLKTNALALAIGVIIGAAVGKVVSSIVSDLLMPVIGILIPGGEWRTIKIPLTHKPDGTVANAFMVGNFLGNVIDFVIIAFVIFMITKALFKPAPAPPPPPTKTCKDCLESVAAEAKKCKFCGSAV
jgi:large conductance mechanosensitive channel